MIIGAVAAPELLTSLQGKPSEFFYTIHSYWAGVRVLLASGGLAVVGHAVLSYTQALWLRSGSPTHFHALVVGQCTLTAWIYLRSAFNQLTGSVPMGTWELYTLVGASIVALCFNKQKYSFGMRQESAAVWVLFGLLVFAICEHELPRTLMLSTDPDEHAFFVEQFIRQQSLPYDLGAWGPESFEYPAGSGALGFLWHNLTGLGARNIITILPPLSGLIALMVIYEAGRDFLDDVRPPPLSRLVSTMVALVFVYHYVMPFGMDLGHAHQEGTARLMVISLFALGVSAATKVAKPVEIARLGGFALVAGAVLATGWWLNPINGFNLAFAFGAAVLSGVKTPLRQRGLACLLFCLLGFAALSLDPYYLELLSGAETTHVGTETQRRLGAPAAILTGFLRNLLGRLSRGALIDAPIAELAHLNAAWALVPLGAIIAYFHTPRRALIRGGVALVSFGALIASPLTALFETLSQATSLRLLHSYYVYSVGQMMYLCTLLLLGVAIYLWPKRTWWVAVLAFGAMIGLHQLQAGQRIVRFSPRVTQCGSRGCMGPGDAAALAYLESSFASYIRDGGSIRQERIPKILLPNELLTLGGEQWLFPRGASRAVPFRQTFPAAFFYFHGHPHYSYAAYERHVCSHLDIPWLLRHNIRFLFLPSDRGETCVARLEGLQPVFSEANAQIYDLRRWSPQPNELEE